MGRRRRRAEDPLGLGRLSKSFTLASNRMAGKMAEDSFALSQEMQGNRVKRTHVGRDLEVQRRDFFGNPVGKPISYEVKSGNPKLSKTQKGMKKRLGRKYIVVRS